MHTKMRCQKEILSKDQFFPAQFQNQTVEVNTGNIPSPKAEPDERSLNATRTWKNND